TRDGYAVQVMLNAGLLVDMPNLQATGADGIGLYRTELPFMARPELPDVAAQTMLYRKIIDQAEGKPVVFRTLDVGGDKVLPYWNPAEEDNPALGWRSVRISLDCPAVLRQQVRALIRAHDGRELRVMFPMIAEIAEFDRARALLDMEIERQALHGIRPSRVLVGTMMEVPALAWQMAQLLKRVDFISIGSNDLAQFLFASDRGNPRVSDRYDVLSLPMLAFIRWVVEQAHAAGVPVSVCGEMAGRPLDAMVLVALGIRTLSVAAPCVGPVKMMIRSLDLTALRQYTATIFDLPDHSLREKVRLFAKDHGIAL
ncbi:MAG: peptidase, partial [Rhodospirillales bacterium]|nr:peptidase [Rhodospirillales bacterium]